MEGKAERKEISRGKENQNKGKNYQKGRVRGKNIKGEGGKEATTKRRQNKKRVIIINSFFNLF